MKLRAKSAYRNIAIVAFSLTLGSWFTAHAQQRLTDEQLDKIEAQADLTKCQVQAERAGRKVQQLQKELDALKLPEKSK